MKSRNLVIPVVAALTLIIISPYVTHPAEAHILKTFAMQSMPGMNMPSMPANVSVKIGWLHEPPLVGDLNEIDVYVYNGTDDTAPPIANTGLDNMTINVQYGGQTKTLGFDPSDDTPGLYTAALTPDQLGTYNVIIQGTINGTNIPSTTYPMQEVESKDKYYFPPMTGNMPGMNMSNTGTNNAVPEFGPVASLVLVLAIISVVIVTGKTRGFLKF
ncbi:MAG TPA: PEFG-CTERM sorting domain-containing protein [Candidatus Bathyarchaeia archaeon]|nr:PEFG-CTERM sorting domain-containing protein [Candidatus Bathyarchaeia archaeon]